MSPYRSRMPTHPQNLTVASTGASGSAFLRQLLLAIERDDRVQNVNFIASDSGLRVMAEELGLQGRSNLLQQIMGRGKPSSKSVKSSAAANRSSKIKIKEQ